MLGALRLVGRPIVRPCSDEAIAAIATPLDERTIEALPLIPLAAFALLMVNPISTGVALPEPLWS